ncbi:sensor histidine kinase [Aurantimonas sp. A2-1-M11]|uniref:sensor histidine kinase n=1 Tax=Aurantimonas sp. A2-1-M11 TaxID=3113712 RepID=UPI002F93D325
MSKIQRQLHDPSRQSLDMAPYLSQLGADLLAASGVTGVTYETEVAPTEVDAETAVPLALIVTELISNAIEHGCADGRPGTIRVTLQQEGKQGNTLRLQVADDGPGWPEGFSIAESRNLGMRIVGSLTQQIGGSFEASNDAGAVATLVFEARPAFAPQPAA